ncbi:MAG: SUMF1/EgtB/PvdO family nonheme iron enzyme [Planctomycetes bacterium]|nr:SUMF1/EgtB/PvdO family nonheme iron enzyme [Planctomycetota bacterium]
MRFPTHVAGDDATAEDPSAVQSSADLEARMLRALELAEPEQDAAIAALAAELPQRAATIWRWVAEIRRESATRASLARPIAEFEPRAQLGPYRVAERLGQGGMGTVVAARHEEHGTEVALKLIRADLLEQPEARERFHRELSALRRVEHPALCPVLDVGEANGVPYFAMPRLRGEDLGRKIARARRAGSRGPVALAGTQRELSALLVFFENAARGLHAAHLIGLVHRDVKPGNLFCTDDGAPVVLDFGLARDTHTDATTLAGSRELLGTLEYMPPEQIRGERTLDARADVYALAASLYEALSLELPWRGRTRSETLERILREEVPPISRVRPELPRELSHLLSRALEKDPARRPRDAAAFADELGRVRRGERVLLRADGPARRLLRWCRRYPLAAAALAATTVFSTAAAGLALSREAALEREREAHARAHTALQKFRLTEHATRLAHARLALESLPPLTASECVAAHEHWLARYAEPLREGRAELLAQRLAWQQAGMPSDAARQVERELAQEIDDLRAELARFEARCATLRPAEEEVDELWAELGRLQRAALAEHLLQMQARLEAPRGEFLADGAEEFLYAELGRLLEELARFERDERSGIAAIEHRLALARAAHASLSEAEQRAWAAARAALHDDPRFASFDLVPEPGLTPLGPDPRSGLQEFACRFSGAPPARKGGALHIEDASAIVFVLLPGGAQRIGAQRRDRTAPRYDAYSPSDMGPHEVRLAPFLLAKHELSQGQWMRLAGGANPSYVRPGNVPFDQPTGETYPVESLSWIEARALLRVYGMELPTEAQWEHGARGGSDAVFPWGDEPRALEGYANLFGREMAGLPANLPGGPAPLDDGAKLPLPIDALEPNEFGLHHVIGNVSEWCRDAFWTWRTTLGEGDGLVDFPLARYRSFRGGSYLDGWLTARLACRRKASPDDTQVSLGVRPARALRSR